MAIYNPIHSNDPYGRRVLDSFSKSLGVFSGGMALASLAPNPVTPAVAVGSGILATALSVTNQVIYG